MAPTEPEHGQCTERDDDDLGKRECKWRRPDKPERREQREERIDVRTEPHHLLTRRAVRDLERVAVRRAPDGLHHVSEIEAPLAEVPVTPVDDRRRERPPPSHRHPDGDRPSAVAHERHRPRRVRPDRPHVPPAERWSCSCRPRKREDEWRTTGAPRVSYEARRASVTVRARSPTSRPSRTGSGDRFQA